MSPSQTSYTDPLYLDDPLEPTYPSIHHLGHQSWKVCKITPSLPPDYIKSSNISHLQSWEFGVIGYYIETGKHPYVGYPSNIEDSFLVNSFDDFCPPEITDLLMKCVNKNVDERYELNELVNKMEEIYDVLSTWVNTE